ncbi:sugar phosphate isomerase/epimerase family protein [Foetidibacter luteolus]|uniref:sugar phosphate isomerase/epimerase family protein n=1 Tax=Foetidibacter luteolus TaxID=2608880 RepID=UPI00129A46D0|nr:sugar phosphate isomerase/epimerase [Foetidibacter luteolus]
MNNNNTFTRRDFMKLAGTAGAAALLAPNLVLADEARKRNFSIGSTFILWGYGADNLEPALSDIAKLGYHSFETFGQVIEEWEKNRGGFKQVVEKYKVPIVSAFCMTDVLDPSKRKDETEKLVRWAKLLKASGGKVVEYCPTGIKREGYNYKDHKKNLVESMNEYAKAVTDEGLVCALHPHTGTPIETEEEVYFIMENLNTDYMKFGPDVGQLQKGGADPVKIVKDFMPLIEHVHLKDYAGGDNGYLGYAPLGTGKVKIEKILNLLEKRKHEMAGMIMFELDHDNKIKPAYTQYEAARVSHDYLQKLGYSFNA